jgi:hypothetical protein
MDSAESKSSQPAAGARPLQGDDVVRWADTASGAERIDEGEVHLATDWEGHVSDQLRRLGPFTFSRHSVAWEGAALVMVLAGSLFLLGVMRVASTGTFVWVGLVFLVVMLAFVMGSGHLRERRHTAIWERFPKASDPRRGCLGRGGCSSSGRCWVRRGRGRWRLRCRMMRSSGRLGRQWMRRGDQELRRRASPILSGRFTMR